MPPAPLSQLDAAQAALRVAELQRAAQSSGEAARRVARSFPLLHADPDVRAALASLARHLADYAPALPEDPDPALRPRWDAAAVAANAETTASWNDDRVLAALVHLSPAEVRGPSLLVARLATIASAEASIALLWARRFVVRGTLTASDALSQLEPLSRHAEADVRACFVDALAEPWLALTARAPLYRRALRDADVDVVRQALPHVEVKAARVRALVPALGEDAHLALVRLGDARDLDAALSVRAAVIGHHRVGRFAKSEHVPKLLEHFEEDHEWLAEEFARVTFTCRAAVLDALSTLAPNDPRWRRLAPLLAHVEGRSTRGQSAAEIVGAMLRACTAPDVVGALAKAAADHPEFTDEDALLLHLEGVPDACLEALVRHGTERSLPTVLALLRDPLAFGAARRAALDWCWMIAKDRLVLIAEYGAASWTREQLASAAPPHPAAAARALEAAAHGDARARLNVLVGVFEDLDVLTEPFRTAVREELLVSGARRPRDPALPTEAEQALLRAEGRWGALKRRLTRYPDGGPGTLVRAMTLDWLREARRRGETRDLILALGILARHPIAVSQLRYVHPLWRAKDASVQRAAVEALLRCRHSAGLARSLSLLVISSDPRVKRQGLRAIEHFASRWAEPEVLRALDAPNMNLKKAAASALGVVGSPACVPALTRWLGVTDNPGLRSALLIALENVAGAATNALLLQAYESADAAHRENLVEALQGRLSSTQLAAFSSRDMSLANACRAGALRLGAGSWSEVALEIRRAGGATETNESAIDRLERLGFSEERAIAALEEGSERLTAVIASRLPEWARFAAETESHAAVAARWVLAASVDLPPEDALVVATRAKTAPDIAQAVEALRRAASHGEGHRLRAIDALRALEVPAHQRWAVLRDLDAVVTRSDLEAALSAAEANDDLRPLLEDVLPQSWQDAMERPPQDRRAFVLARWMKDAVPVARRRVRAPGSRIAKRTSLAEVLSGEAEIPPSLDERARLANALTEWPAGEAEQRRAVPLIAALPLHRLRVFLVGWLDEARAGSQLATQILRAVPREELLAHPGIEHGERGLVSLGGSRDRRLAEQMEEHRFGPSEEEPAAAPTPDPPDPLDEVEGEDALLSYAENTRGREASRAVGRLGTLGAREHLLRVLDHSDANPRTVAMRWLRKLMERDDYLALALRHLQVERDSHLRRSLLRSIARPSFSVAFPVIVTLVLDNDRRVAREAQLAVRRLGEVIEPAVERTLAQERPDRARRLRALLR